MKLFTHLMAATALFAGAATANAQIEWNEDGEYVFDLTTLVAEGGLSINEDEGTIVNNGGEGRLLIAIPEGTTLDLSEVARIEVSQQTLQADGESWAEDPKWGGGILNGLYIHDRDNGTVNTWAGSRYSCDYKDYAAKSAHVDTICWIANPDTTGVIAFDEVKLIKSLEVDPNAVTFEMFHEWSDGTAAATITKEVCNSWDVTIALNTELAPGGVLLQNGNVAWNIYADLTEIADGLYFKGTPGMQLRVMFNRLADGGQPDAGLMTEIDITIPEEGEYTMDFATATHSLGMYAGEKAFFSNDDNKFVHLTCIKLGWGSAPGKITKMNIIPKGTSGIKNVAAKEAVSDAPVFNILGQKVEKPVAGQLYFQNGKKMIFK